MKPPFALRIDLDSRVCVRKGLPALLAMLRRNDAPATFYIAMGREPFLPAFWAGKLMSRGRYRSHLPAVARPRRRKTALAELARRVVLPANFARENRRLLRGIPDAGHMPGAHTTCHERWALSLPEIDVRAEFSRMGEEFESVFGFEPRSFAAPMFRTDARVLGALDESGYATAGDLDGDLPFHPVLNGRKFRHVQVPVNLKCADTVPLIEDLWARGLPQEEIARRVCSRIDEKVSAGRPAVLYGHGFLEGTLALPALELVVRHAKDSGCEFVTMDGMARRYPGRSEEVGRRLGEAK
ncbi:MAG: polysaccharide deacetylase family protein [Candidatus Micrarchaeota archaeon]